MTLFIAVAGLVIAAISLSWQVWTYLRSGPRIIVTWNGSYRSSELAWESPDRASFVAVHAFNAGKAPATVTAWGLEYTDKEDPELVTFPSDPRSASTPARVDSHDEVTFYVPMPAVWSRLGRDTYPSHMRPWVQLASGRRVTGKLKHLEWSSH